MNCKDAQTLINEYEAGELSETQIRELRQHTHVCGRCRRTMSSHDSYLQNMRDMPIPAMSAGFAQRAIRKAATQQQHKRQGFIYGFGTAMVASLALLIAVGIFMPNKELNKSHKLSTISLALHEERNINLVFDSPNAVANATLSIQLPAHVEVVGYSGQRVIAWQTSIQQGKNILSLPLRATAIDQSNLIASITSGDSTKTFQIQLGVQSNKQSSHQLLTDFS